MPNNRFPKSGRLPNIETHGLQTHQPLPDTSPTRKTIRNQNVGQSGKKPDRRRNLISGHDNEQINEFRNEPIEDVRLGIDRSFYELRNWPYPYQGISF